MPSISFVRSILGKVLENGVVHAFDRPEVNCLAHTQCKNALDDRSGRVELVDVRSTEIAFEHKCAVFGDQEAVDAVVSIGFDAVDQANECFLIAINLTQIGNLDSVVALFPAANSPSVRYRVRDTNPVVEVPNTWTSPRVA